MQSHHRLDAVGDEQFDLVAIVSERGLVPLAWGRLDLGPLNREAVLRDVELAKQLRIFGETIPVVAGGAGALAVFDFSGKLFPRPPVAVGVAALDLMGGSSDTPLKAFGEIAMSLRRGSRQD